jgi:hypothetical protein
MAPRAALLAAAFTVLISSGGCSTAIYYAASRAGHETPPEPRLSLTRDQVDAGLGTPSAVTPLPDGGHLATYKYRQRDPKAKEGVQTSAGIHAAIGFLTRGYGWFVISPLVEPVLMGMAIHRAANPPHGEALFTFSPDGQLMGYGRPPQYGPDDAVAEAPSLGAIRQSCWAYAEERAYVECIATRFAIWSLD